MGMKKSELVTPNEHADVEHICVEPFQLCGVHHLVFDLYP